MLSSISWSTSVVASKSLYAMKMNLLISTLCNRYNSFTFDLQFQMQRLAQNDYLTSAWMLKLLSHILQIFHHSSDFTAAETLRKLSRQLSFASFDIDDKVFIIECIEKLLRENEKISTWELSHNFSVTKQHSHVNLVHKTLIMSIDVYLEESKLKMKNRVLRAYFDHADYFIHVIFSNEDEERMIFDRFVSLEKIFHSRFKNILDEVILIANHHFAFLDFLHSSLQDQTCWFMTSFKHNDVLLNATVVIINLDNFSAIRSSTKCAVRIDQAFFNIDEVVRISSATVDEISNVKRNQRVFFNDVETISTKTLIMLWKEYASARKCYECVGIG